MPYRLIRLAKMLVVLALAAHLIACGAIGDVSSIKEANELAVDCQTDKALAALEKAHQEGGLSGYLAMLEKVVVLRDVGRTAAADAALKEYMALPEVEAGDREETEQSIEKSLQELRKLRREKTGSATCP